MARETGDDGLTPDGRAGAGGVGFGEVDLGAEEGDDLEFDELAQEGDSSGDDFDFDGPMPEVARTSRDRLKAEKGDAQAAAPKRKGRWLIALGCVAGLAVAVALVLGSGDVGCAWFGSGDPAPPLDAAARRERIEVLRQTIRDDHTALEELITLPESEREVDLHRDPRVETIATRLGRNEAELARLVAIEDEEVR